MRKLTAWAAAAAAPLSLLLAMLAPSASATTAACIAGDSGFCGGQITNQSAPLELAVAVPIAQVHAGTRVVGREPAFSGREDWDARHPANSGSGSGGPDKVFRWAPRGTPRNLCLTAVSDQARSRPALEPCVAGSLGASHQIWRPENVIGGGFVVWINEANGLALTVVGDFQDAPVQIRSVGLGTGANKNWAFVGTAP